MKTAPSPWSVDMGSEGKMWTDSISISDSEGGHVAHLTRGYEGDSNNEGCPSWANAHLIAAAPDLLAALSGVDHVIQQWRESGREPAYNQWLSLQEIARAAIAKATA